MLIQNHENQALGLLLLLKLPASMQALIQFILLSELILGSWTPLSRRVCTETNRIPLSITSLFGLLYSGIITIVGSLIVTLGC